MAKHDFDIRLSFIFIALFLILSVTGNGFAASFSADMVVTLGGKVKTSKIFLLDHQYRLDLEEDGRALNILVNRKSGKTRIVVPDEKIYLEMANSDIQSLMNNPFAAHRYMAENYQVQLGGKETVNGLSCDKQTIVAHGKEMMTVWVATEYDFPVKLENRQDERLLELKNLKQGGATADLFQMPTGFKQVTSMPIAPPEWAPDIADAPIMTPPFEKVLSEGRILRIRPVNGFNIKLHGKGVSGQKGTFTSTPFKDGRPLKIVAGFPVGSGITHKESPSEADEIVVRAKTGQIRISAELVEAPEGIILKHYDLKANYGRQFIIDHRKSARLIVSDNMDDGKRSRGTITIYKIIAKDMDGGTVYDRKEVQQEALLLANGESRMWQFDRKQEIGSVHISMLEGGVRARVEQPEKAGAIPPSWATVPAGVTMAAATSTPAPAQEMSAAKTAAQPQSSAVAGSVAGRMVLVLDGSGSMWGQIEGKSKIAIAKEVLTDLIDQIPKDFQTGLIVYGHRRKGDCNDIEMMMPVRLHNPSAMKAKVQGISPKGKTPLSESVRQAAKALRYTEERSTVVLVSDGLETCDIDPCELAAELAMSGADFTVHVIGFDISKEDQGRLRCLADKTGGLFLAADNAGALRDALLTTVKQVKQPLPPVVEDSGTATLSGPPSVPVGSEFTVKWEGPDSRNDYIALFKKTKTEPLKVDYTYTEKGNPSKFVAPGDVGEYELGYVHAHTRKVIGRTDITVTPVQATVQAPTSVDVATDFDVQWQGPNYKSDYIAIARSDQRPGSQLNYTYTSRGNPAKVQAPSDPGTYEIRYMLGRGNKLLAKTTIEITGVGASVDAPVVADVATDFEVSWQGPDSKSDYIAIARSDQQPGSQINYTYTKRGNPVMMQAPSDPGIYEVRYILGRGNKLLAKTTIQINAVTAQVQAPASADVATDFEVSWQGPDSKSDYIAIARSDQQPGSQINYTYTKRGNPVMMQAPSDPGTYEVRYILGRGNKLLAKTTIQINAVTAKVNAPVSARTGETFEVNWQGPDSKSDYISISLPDQRPGSYKGYTYTSRGNPAKVKAPKEPDTYEVRYILGRGNKLLDKTTIEITP